jgi:glucosamine-6-phosphate deaminase
MSRSEAREARDSRDATGTCRYNLQSMTTGLPEYLKIPPQELGGGTPVRVEIVGDIGDVSRHFARALFDEIAGKSDATMILPVGPVDQFPVLAEMINQARLDCREVAIINMDEYIADDEWISIDHPLSFRGYMNRKFYDLLEPTLAPRPENRIFPDPTDLSSVRRVIDARGGLDVCYGGIGINGHIAFNEPPEPGEPVDTDEFAARPTRVVSLTRETITINSNTVGGELSIIPRRAVTVGMREILSAGRLRFYCNRPWQSAVIRRALHGPVTAACPASLLRIHSDAAVTIADYVAEIPDIRLR